MGIIHQTKTDIWVRQSPLDCKLLPIIKQRIHDQVEQQLFQILETSPKCRLYKHLVDTVTLQFYLTKYIPMQYRTMITKCRLSAHTLAIETGRYTNVIRQSRICQNCNTGEVEDEFHFAFICPLLSEIRTKYIKKYYWHRPSVYKLIQLLTVHSLRELTKLGKFLVEANKLRSINP